MTIDLLGHFRIVEVIVGLLHLHVYEIARQSNLSDVVARIALHSHHIALMQVELLVVQVIALSGVLELHLYIITFADILWHVAQPVIYHERLVLTAVGAEATGIVAIVYVCIVLIIRHCGFTLRNLQRESRVLL